MVSALYDEPYLYRLSSANLGHYSSTKNVCISLCSLFSTQWLNAVLCSARHDKAVIVWISRVNLGYFRGSGVRQIEDSNTYKLGRIRRIKENSVLVLCLDILEAYQTVSIGCILLALLSQLSLLL